MPPSSSFGRPPTVSGGPFVVRLLGNAPAHQGDHTTRVRCRRSAALGSRSGLLSVMGAICRQPPRHGFAQFCLLGGIDESARSTAVTSDLPSCSVSSGGARRTNGNPGGTVRSPHPIRCRREDDR
jgi:hypothetical protein